MLAGRNTDGQNRHTSASDSRHGVTGSMVARWCREMRSDWEKWTLDDQDRGSWTAEYIYRSNVWATCDSGNSTGMAVRLWTGLVMCKPGRGQTKEARGGDCSGRSRWRVEQVGRDSVYEDIESARGRDYGVGTR
jgi:hypothetical protein